METLRLDYNETKEISIFFLGDLHIGNVNFAEKELKRHVQLIKTISEKRPTAVFLLGDVIEAISVKDKRFNPNQSDGQNLDNLVLKQMERAGGYLEPIKHLIKGAVIGNHEEKFRQYNSVDAQKFLCNYIFPDCKNLHKFGIVDIRIRNTRGKRIVIAITHGVGGGGHREGYPITNAVDIFKAYDVNVGVIGHTHKIATYELEQYQLDQVGHLKIKKKHIINTGCYLKTLVEGNENYFEGHKGSPSSIGMVELFVYEFGGRKDGKKHSTHKEKVIIHKI